MKMKTNINVGQDFYHRLANRHSGQGDGKHTAVEFRDRYLSQLDDPEAWKSDLEFIVLDFSSVNRISPSFASEAFGYFRQYAKASEILKKIRIINASKVQMMIIEMEVEGENST